MKIQNQKQILKSLDYQDFDSKSKVKYFLIKASSKDVYYSIGTLMEEFNFAHTEKYRLNKEMTQNY